MVTQLALLGHGQVHGLNHLLLQVIELTVMTGTLAADCEALAAPRATPLGPKVGEIVVASFAEEEEELALARSRSVQLPPSFEYDPHIAEAFGFSCGGRKAEL